MAKASPTTTPPPAQPGDAGHVPARLEDYLPANKAPVQLGIAPTTVDEAWRLAVMLSKSELVPKAFRERPADILVAVQLGAELGMAPGAALQSIAVINGRPGLWGDGLLAVVMASPLYLDHDEYFDVGGKRREIVDGLTPDALKADSTAAICTFLRKGKSTPTTRRFSVAQARKARLLTKDGPWQDYPDRMLQMRARSWAARDTFPDLLRGLKAAEELYDLPADTLAAPLLRRVRRASELAAAAAPELDPDTIRAGLEDVAERLEHATDPPDPLNR